MSKLEELNRSVNRVLRALNSLAVSVASSSLADRSSALDEVTQALEHVNELQRRIVASDPTLEYHHDPHRPPTKAMKAIADLVEEAEQLAKKGDAKAAEEALKRACAMEPPPLAYEMIEKRIRTLRGA